MRQCLARPVSVGAVLAARGRRPLASQLCAALVLLLPGATRAHWVTHEHLPRWAQRGVMRSCLCPFDWGILKEWIDVDPMACHFNVLFTSIVGWEDERAPTDDLLELYIRPRDGHLFLYTCPNSIYWDDEFERAAWTPDLAFDRFRLSSFLRYPYAKDCINYDSDGKATVAYPWPSRRHRTSYFATQWVSHHSQVMDYFVHGENGVTNPHLRKYILPLKHAGIVDGFYFDNAGLREDWGPLAMARWGELSTARFGEARDPLNDPGPEVRLAWKDMQHRAYFEFHNAFRKHGWAYNPPRLTLLGAHGPYGYYADEYGFPDIEFYENTYRVPPAGDNVWALKRGLARTHGKAQACLNHERFPPARLSGDDSFKVLYWSMTPEFGRLSMAECMAMDGNHMLHMGPLIYGHQRFVAHYRLYSEFNKQFEDELYANALPGAKLAVLWPVASESRGTPDNEPLGTRLWTLGFPYEVVMEHDLTPGIWPGLGMDVLIVPGAQCLDESRAAVILDWVRWGGRCLIAQALAERSEYGRPQQSASARALLGRAAGRIRYVATLDFALDGFEPETGQGRIWLPARRQFTEKTSEGTAVVTFTGAVGVYDMLLDYLDEDDGVSSVSLFLNDEPLLAFRLDQGEGNQRVTKTLRDVRLTPGDRIGIHAKQSEEEFCRVYGVELVSKNAEARVVVMRDVGEGRVGFAPLNLMEYDEAEFVRALEDLTDGGLERCVYGRVPGEMGAVFCNLMQDAGRHALQVHLVNATYSTPERYASLRSTDYVCRVDIPVDSVPVRPVLRALCWGMGEGWRLTARVNGLELEPVPAKKIRTTWWVDMPLDPAMVKTGVPNRVEMRLAGKVNTYNTYAAIYLDTEQTEPPSAFSSDGGATYLTDDLSPMLGAQQGAYMISIASALPRTPNPPEMRVRLVPKRDVEVVLRGSRVPAGASALVVSPDLPPARVPLQREAGAVSLRVPKLHVYDVVLLSADDEYLEAVEAKAGSIRFDPLPPRTPEFRELLRAGAAGEKLIYGSVEGDFRLRGVTSIDPTVVAGRNDPRQIGIDIDRGKDFIVEPDGRLYILPTSRTNSRGEIFLTWTGLGGGHYREGYAPYVRHGDEQLLPPGWRLVNERITKVVRETAPEHVREGEASAKVTAQPGGGIYTVSSVTDPGRPYHLSVWVKVPRGGVQVVITNGTQAEPAACGPGDWRELTVDFTADGRRVDFRVVAGPGHDESEFYLDNVSLRERVE